MSSQPTPYFQIDAGSLEARQFNFDQSTGRLTWMSSDATETTASKLTDFDAMSYSPVFAGITMIAGDISGMPWMTKKKVGDTIEDADDHSTRKLLLERTGDNEFTSNLFVESIVARALFYGLGGAYIKRGGPLYRPIEIELIRSPIAAVERLYDGRAHKFYAYTDINGRYHERTPDEMFILPGPTMDAFNGMGLRDYARATVGRAVAAGKYTDQFYTGGGVPKGFFTHPGELTGDAQERFLNGMAANKNKDWRLLEEGMGWLASGIPPIDAMVVQMLNLSEEDVSRFLRIPISELAGGGGGKGGGGSAPAKSVEQRTKLYLRSCLNFWKNRLVREANDKLFREDEKGTYYTCFDDSEFVSMTATLEERTEADKADIMSGVRTLNEVRGSRQLNRYDDEIGDKPLLPLNMTTNPANLEQADTPKKSPPASGDGSDNDERSALLTLQRDVLLSEMRRIATKLVNEAVRASKNGNFLQSLDDMVAKLRPSVMEAMRSPVALVAFTLRRDATATLDATAEDVLQGAHETFLRASECDADKLETSVRDSSPALRSKLTEIANQLCEV